MDRNHSIFVARVLLSLLFVVAGWGKLMNFNGTVGFVESLGFPIATVMATLLIIFELVGGLMLLVGFRTKIAAYALLFITLVATGIAHNPIANPAEQTMFLKNLAIAGGMILVSITGPGSFSVDRK